MKKLGKIVDLKGGRKAVQVVRKNDFAIYKVSDTNYEVIIIKTADPILTRLGFKTEGGEQYPRSSQWGSLGWSFIKLENAQKKFDWLCETML